MSPPKRKKSVPAPLTAYYPTSGYFVARSSGSDKASAMTMSIPDGKNRMLGHSHDDELSMQIYVNGTQFIGTPASALYEPTNDGKYRQTEYRGFPYSMCAHNVVLVNGEPAQSIESLINAWHVVTIPAKSSYQARATGASITASHQGYEGRHLKEIR